MGLAAAPIVITATWNHHLKISGISGSVGATSIPSLIRKSTECCQAQRQVEVAGKFFAEVFDQPPPKTNEVSKLSRYALEEFKRVSIKKILFDARDTSVANAWVFLLTASVAAALYFRSVLLKIRFIALGILMSIGFFLYLFSLLLFYLYAMPEYEARQLASFNRFVNVYILGWMMVVVFAVGAAGSERSSMKGGGIGYLKGRDFVLLLFWILMFVLIAPKEVKHFLLNGPPRIFVEKRADIKEWATRISEYVPKDARIFILWQGSDGRELWMLRYEMLPRPANSGCFSLRVFGSGHDMYECELATEDLKKLLAGYDYVLIGSGARSIHSQYSSIFHGAPIPADRAAYKIDKDNNTVILRRLLGV